MTTILPTFEGTAIVELLGHRTLAGVCREVDLCGVRMLRVDVVLPGGRTTPHLVPPNSIYALTPVPAETIDDRWQQRNEDVLFGYSLLAPDDLARREARLAARHAEAQERRTLALVGLGIDIAADDCIDASWSSPYPRYE